MADLPVVCDNCGRFFRAPNIIGGSGGTFTMMNVAVSPCPYCGGRGHVPDGVYELWKDTIRAVWSSRPTVEDLRALERVVEQAQTQGLSPDETAQRVEELGDRFKRFSDFIREHAVQLTLLVMMLELLLRMAQSPNVIVNVEQPPPVEVVIQQLPERGGSATEPEVPKVGRNEPCPCGSGKKYKHCHGAPGQSQRP
jgi:uncharacterized protein YecA (UPF0149 family)